MNASREAIRLGINGYVDALNAIGLKHQAEVYPMLPASKFYAEFGSRYAKIVVVSGASRSVHSFVDRTNGDILKAASWRAPAKHPRGSVLNADFGIKGAGATVYGVRYL